MSLGLKKLFQGDEILHQIYLLRKAKIYDSKPWHDMIRNLSMMLNGSNSILFIKSCFMEAPIQLIKAAVLFLLHAKFLPALHPLNYLEINFAN